MNKSFLLLPAIALSAALVGCERADDSTTAGTDATRGEQTAPERRAQAPAPERRADAPTPGAGQREGMGERAGAQVSDSAITAEVKSALAADPQLSALQIDVDTEKGVVTLSGPAPDEQSKSRATQIAAAPKGVVRVENRLEVRSS